MVTIIHLSQAPNPKVGPPSLHRPRTAPIYTLVPFDPFQVGGGVGYPYVGEYQIKYGEKLRTQYYQTLIKLIRQGGQMAHSKSK